jgi:hypothetical protein
MRSSEIAESDSKEPQGRMDHRLDRKNGISYPAYPRPKWFREKAEGVNY